MFVPIPIRPRLCGLRYADNILKFAAVVCYIGNAFAQSYTGSLSGGSDSASMTFSVSAPRTVVVRTMSYAGGTDMLGRSVPAGGFDPTLTLLDSRHIVVAANVDGGCGSVTKDVTTALCLDAYIQTPILAPGTYTAVLTQSPCRISSSGAFCNRSPAWQMQVVGADPPLLTTTPVIVSLPVAPSAPSPTAITYRIKSPKIYPGWRYQAPQKRIISLTAPANQSWTIAVSGNLTSVCLYWSSCFQITDEYSNAPVAGGVGPRRLAVNWYGSQGPVLDPGRYDAVISFSLAGSAKAAAVPVSLLVLGATEMPALGEPKATAIIQNGCTFPDPALSYSNFASNCAIPSEAPIANPALTMPAVGGSFIDPVFGGKITRITGPGCSTEYGTTTAFSALHTYIWNSCGVYRTADAHLIRSRHANIDVISMSATDDEVYYYFSGSQLRHYNFVRDEDVILGDFAGSPYGFKSLYAGGTAQTSDDDWIAFYDYSSPKYPKICAVSLTAMASAGGPNNSNTYCAVYQGTQPLGFLDWVSATEKDDVTGKRYVYLSAIPLSIVFSVGQAGSGSLTQEYIVPEWPGWARNNDDGICSPNELCYNANNFTHNSLYKDRDGQVKMWGNFEDILLNRNYNTTYTLNAGLGILRLEEEGGGASLVGRYNWDKQPGCSTVIAGCTAAPIESGKRYAARVIAATPDADKVTLTLSAPTYWVPSSQRKIRIANGVGLWSCLNGAWNATVLPGNLLSISGTSCAAASGSLDRVILGDAVTPFAAASSNINRSQIQIWRPGRQIHRIAMHRSVEWMNIDGTGISSYEATPRASISRDGQFVAFSSNWGALDFDGVSVYIVETGLGNPANRITVSGLVPAGNGAALSYSVANGQACTIELSADSTFQTLVETFVDPAGPLSRLTHLGRTVALSPATNYWMRMQCGMEVESMAFQTLAHY